MTFTLQQIATIRSPFCNLVEIPVQPKGAKDTYATIEFKKSIEKASKT